jgi:hypothetical protein
MSAVRVDSFISYLGDSFDDFWETISEEHTEFLRYISASTSP